MFILSNKLIEKFLILFSITILFFIKNVSADSTIYLLGDSRFVGMSNFDENENHIYYAKEGQGLTYLKSYFNEIENEIKNEDYVIINFGVNDFRRNKDDYAPTINNFAKKVNCNIIYMTVNPVDEYMESLSGYNIKNEDVDNFNLELANNLNDNIYMIDTNKYLKLEGFETRDGLHYSKETYEDILNYIDIYLESFEEN